MRENQEFIDYLHLQFKDRPMSENLQQWDNLMAQVIQRDFTEERAAVFFELHATLIQVFADELIAFIIDYFTNTEENK